MKRRNFLKNILGAGTLGMFGASTNALMASTPAFSDYKALSPAKDYKNRHASIMLILHTIIDGFEKCGEN